MKKLYAIGVLLAAACGGETGISDDDDPGNVRDRRGVKPRADGGALVSDAGAAGSDAGVSPDAGQGSSDAGGSVPDAAADTGGSGSPDAGSGGPSAWETRMPVEGAWDVDLYLMSTTCRAGTFADFGADVWTFSAVAGQYRNILLGTSVGGPYQRTDYNTWMVGSATDDDYISIVLTLSTAGILEGTRTAHTHNPPPYYEPCTVVHHVEGVKP